MANLEITTHKGTACFSSIENWIPTGAKGWTEDDAVSDEQLQLLLENAETKIANFGTTEGKVVFSTSAHIVTARK